MKFSKLADAFAIIEETTSRNEITQILAKVFEKASVAEIDKICYLSLGRLVPLFETMEFNIAEKMMLSILKLTYGKDSRAMYKKLGDLGEVAYKLKIKNEKLKIAVQNSKLSVEDVYDRLYKISTTTGTGSVEKKTALFSKLLSQLNPLSAKYVTRIPIGKLRMGFSDVTLLDALSWMDTGNKSLRPELERAYNVSADIGRIAKVFKKSGLPGTKRIKSKVGTPIRTAQAERLPSAEAAVEKLEKFAVEAKYDGFRVQIHLDKTREFDLPHTLEKQASLFKEKKSHGPFVRIFSRNLDNITAMFPDIVKAVQKLKVEKAIFDGEAIAYSTETEEFLPFQETVQRKRKYDILKKAKEIPLKVFIYDLLYFDGKALLNAPFCERRKMLKRVLNENSSQILVLTHQDIVTKAKDLKRIFNLYISEGLEGVMCKRLDSPYQAGARNFNWVKYKRATEGELTDNIDGVVLGYYRGRGRRAPFGIGAFLMGVLDTDRDEFVTLAKIGTGVTDEEWGQLKKEFDKNKVSKKPGEYVVDRMLNCDVWIQPAVVVEVKADEITRSPVHTAGKIEESGYALRFPRLIKVREDKRAVDVTTVEEILRLYGFQNK